MTIKSENKKFKKIHKNHKHKAKNKNKENQEKELKNEQE